jgi:flagellar basal body-associated protein FliL
MDTNYIKIRLHEELTRADVKQEIKTVLGSSELKDKINDIIKQNLKSNKELEGMMVDIAGNVLTQLYKTLWTKRNFWRSSLSNKSA